MSENIWFVTAVGVLLALFLGAAVAAAGALVWCVVHPSSAAYMTGLLMTAVLGLSMLALTSVARR